MSEIEAALQPSANRQAVTVTQGSASIPAGYRRIHYLSMALSPK